MQRLPANPVLKYHPDTLTVVRSLYNLNKPAQIDEAVDILDAWVQKQEHFVKKDFSREYLERVIILLKGSVERAKSQLDKICTLRTMMPKFFEMDDPRSEMKKIDGYATMILLPKLTKEHYRIFLMKLNSAGPHTQRKIFLIYFYALMIVEYIKSHDYCDGLVNICDLRGVKITEFVAELNLTELRQLATIAMEGYEARMKSIHFISSSKAIDLLVKIFKQILSTKVGNRIYVHKTIDSLYEFVPQALLPKDYGGDENTLGEINDKLFNTLCSEENLKYLKEMRNARTDENQRSVCTFNENYLGMAGTFRTLNVD